MSYFSAGAESGRSRARRSSFFARLLDAAHGITDGFDLFGGLVGNVEVELGLERHHEFHLIERIGAEVVGDGSIHDDFFLVDAELLDDAFLDFVEYGHRALPASRSGQVLRGSFLTASSARRPPRA